MPRARGLTLVELLVALAIVGALLTMAVPAMDFYVAQHRATTVANHLIGAVQFARAAAITLRGTVTLCPSPDADTCGPRDSWQHGALIFRDADGNGQREGDEAILRSLPALPAGSRVYWRSFRKRSYLSFTPRGLTAWQNGSFRYCPPGGEPELIRELIVNAQGRIRRAPDADGDGVVEDASGDPVSCP